MTHLDTTKKINDLRRLYTDTELSEKIGISRATFYKRLKLSDWKKTEIFFISKIEKI